MNIAIVHYHLNRGGVARVVENQLLALDRALGSSERVRVALLYGGDAHGWPDGLPDRLRSIDLKRSVVEGLGYDSGPTAEPALLADELRQSLARHEFAPDETLLHVHNHSLGKNCSLPVALGKLSEDGFALLLQIHDFAEDFRAANYRHLVDSIGIEQIPAALYPQASQIHYAVLNRRDQGTLQRTGVALPRLHLLPNPVPDIAEPADRADSRKLLHQRLGIPPERRYLLYPVRGIRRKNLGEVLLWSALVGQSTTVGVTLAPLNPVEVEQHAAWARLAHELDLPCLFETGSESGLTFEQNLAAADGFLTTSVAEGFGMVFLESWLAGRCLFGRNLSGITADFADAGVEFPDVYDRLEVPIEWVGETEYAQAFGEACAKLLDAYGMQPLQPARLQKVVDAKMQNGTIDFGDLNEPLQERVLRRVVGDSKSGARLRELNPSIKPPACEDDKLIERNKHVIRDVFSLEPSGQRLLRIYRDLLDSPRQPDTVPPTNPHAVLESYLDLNQMRLLRS